MGEEEGRYVGAGWMSVCLCVWSGRSSRYSNQRGPEETHNAAHPMLCCQTQTTVP